MNSFKAKAVGAKPTTVGQLRSQLQAALKKLDKLDAKAPIGLMCIDHNAGDGQHFKNVAGFQLTLEAPPLFVQEDGTKVLDFTIQFFADINDE